MSDKSSFVVMAFGVEGGLAVMAMLAGWWWQRDPFLGLSLEAEAWPANFRAAAIGALASLPLLGLFYSLDRFPFGPFRKLKQLVDEQLLPLFREATPLELVLICAAAGFGEELLFRGLLQGTLQEGKGVATQLAAVAIGAVCFGACHWISPLYALLATLMGFYFGGLLWATENVLAPIFCHGLYDLAILSLLLSQDKNRRPDQA